MTGKPAWAHEFALGQLARGPVTRTLTAESVERMQLAQELSLDRLDALSATLTVSPWLDGLGGQRPGHRATRQLPQRELVGPGRFAGHGVTCGHATRPSNRSDSDWPSNDSRVRLT